MGVLGQQDFVSSQAPLIPTQSLMSYPLGIDVDLNGTLWESDWGNRRILWFNNAANKVNGAGADGVLGQEDFVSKTLGISKFKCTTPIGLAADDKGTIYVADNSFNRVLGFSGRCSIDSIKVGAQSICDPSNDTYSQELHIYYTNHQPTTKQIFVNGQVFNINNNPATVTLSNLVANGDYVTVYSFFTQASPLFDNFQDGTTQNWEGPDQSPTNIGPGTNGNHSLLISSSGGAGLDGEFIIWNDNHQWAVDWTANEIFTIKLDILNFGANDLSLRIGIDSDDGGRFVTNSPIFVPAGVPSRQYAIPVSPCDFASVGGWDINATLNNVQYFQIFHNTTLDWFGGTCTC